MNEQTKLEIAAVDQQAEEIFNRLEKLGDIDEQTFALIEPDLMACLETATIAGELTALAELVESGELTVGAPAPAVEPAPADDHEKKGGNAFFNFISDLFSDFPQTVVSLIADDHKVAAKDAQKPEGDCCVDVEEPCMSKDNSQPADGAQTKKLPLAEDPQITICIAPSTSEYFKDAKNAEGKDPKDAKPASKDQPAGKLRPAHPEDQLSLTDGLADPEEGGGMCTEDENGAYTCIIVPSHKDLASSLLKGARRMLGFSDKALGNAEKKLPKGGDDADKK